MLVSMYLLLKNNILYEMNEWINIAKSFQQHCSEICQKVDIWSESTLEVMKVREGNARQSWGYWGQLTRGTLDSAYTIHGYKGHSVIVGT